jgi:hypothetical protein
MDHKMKIFNFELEENLDQLLNVKFNGKSDGDSPEVQKPYLDPLNCPLGISKLSIPKVSSTGKNTILRI